MNNEEIANITAGIVIINKSNNVLVEKRKSTEALFPNLYSIPAGKLKYGETIEETAVREVKEEVKLNIDQIIFVNTYFWKNSALYVFASRVNSFPNTYQSHIEVNQHDFAPNINNAISDALSIDLGYFKDIDINELIEDSIELVEKHIIQSKDSVGWDHFIFQNRIGILGTAIGLCILNFKKKDFEKKTEVLKTLLSFQKTDGGWGVQGLDNQYSIVESTCFCLKALINEQSPSYSKAIFKGKKWLIENMLNDFSWAVNSNSKNGRITSTCLAIETLWLLGEKEIAKKSISWLLENRNMDEVWGFTPKGESSISATSEVIIVLSLVDSTEYSNIIIGASDWLLKKMTSINIYDESEQEYINEKKRFEYKHSTKVKVLKALLVAKNTLHNEIICNQINDIINCRNINGAWEHSLTPNNFPIWYLHDIVELLLYLIREHNLNNLRLLNKNMEYLRIQKSLLTFIKKNITVIEKRISGKKFT